MADFHALARKHRLLSEDEQKKAGHAIAGEMHIDYQRFLISLINLIDSKQISTSDPRSFLKMEVYDSLTKEEKGRTNLALLNMAAQIRMIEEFYRSKETPNSSPHLQTMIEHLWLMKQRLEEKHDVFKF